MSTIEVKIPSIGDYADVPVIEVLVKPGDEVKANDALVTLESEKATMDVPSPAAGKIRDLRVAVGDRVREGTVVAVLEQADGAARAAAPAPAAAKAPAQPPAPPPTAAKAPPAPAAPAASAGAPRSIEVAVPNIGNYADVPVIDVLVAPGAAVDENAPLVTLESEKATMDVPSPAKGVVREVRVKPGDRVSAGAIVVLLDAAGAPAVAPGIGAPPAAPATGAPAAAPPVIHEAAQPAPAAAAPRPPPSAREGRAPSEPAEGAKKVTHASPSVRKFARELGVELLQVDGSGPRGRVLREDVQKFVKETLAGTRPSAAAGAGVGLDLLPWPKVDFAKFGPVETQPLSRIKKLSKANLARNWVMIPHVTQHEEADITDLEAFRQELNAEAAGAKAPGTKVTLLAFAVKAVVAALRKYPEFNASLDGDQLVLKRYFHVGFAADTPNGLVVPVIKNADQKGVLELAREMADLAARARDGKLRGEDMQGGCFSISSLGGIGGTFFTPIINAPEVAILGLSRSTMKPVWDGDKFAPRLVLPLSLSYDHRVIDGAAAARFVTYLAGVLRDMRRAML